MIIDAASVPSEEVIKADLCIIGAGPAGLALATEFIGTRQRVYVLESGGEHPDADSLALAEGESWGHPYFPLSTARARLLGGSSYIWEEWMRARPLDPIDFEVRDWIPDSGWPIGYEDLEPFLEQAQEILGLGPFDYEVDRWIGDGETSPIEGSDRLETVLFRYSNTADFTTLRDALEASGNVCLVLNANVLEIVPDESVTRVEHVVVSSANPQRFRVAAHAFVLAAGGLDNPRLLLLSSGRSPHALANDYDLVGRFFMEHPTVRRGIFVPSQDTDVSQLGLFAQHEVRGSTIRFAFAPTRKTVERRRILNGMMLIAPSNTIRASEAFRSIVIIRSAFRERGELRESTFRHLLAMLTRPAEAFGVVRAMSREDYGPPVYQLSITVEQAPLASSRVGLGRKKDRFGQPVVALEWRMGDLERRTVKALQESLDAELRSRGLGRVEGFLGDEFPARLLRGEWHQMGTTRMSDHPSRGVVDSDCRVHGLANLYVAGSSVFPTVGYANPTLTIVALSLRLASLLRAEMASRPSLGPI